MGSRLIEILKAVHVLGNVENWLDVNINSFSKQYIDIYESCNTLMFPTIVNEIKGCHNFQTLNLDIENRKGEVMLIKQVQ